LKLQKRTSPPLSNTEGGDGEDFEGLEDAEDMEERGEGKSAHGAAVLDFLSSMSSLFPSSSFPFPLPFLDCSGIVFLSAVSQREELICPEDSTTMVGGGFGHE
jgi:hypothetical protein